MVCCLLCFDDSPLEGDPRSAYGNKWQISMMDAPCKSPGMFCYSFFCCPCAQYQLREKALQGDWQRYKCCQGYYDACCFKAGSFGDEGNQCCMVLEGCCCLSCAVSSSRMFVMDSRNIIPDPCDNRIIRFNNCIQLVSCVCHILASCFPEFSDLAAIIDFLADIVFYTTQACMTTQTNFELDYEKQQNKQLNWNYQPVAKNWNKGDGANAAPTRPPQGQQMNRGGGQPAVQQAMVAQPRLFQVQCPQNAFAGQQIQVHTPDGQIMGVQVPAGVNPGQVFQVAY